MSTTKEINETNVAGTWLKTDFTSFPQTIRHKCDVSA
jgi:hypothetical protein